MEEKKIDDLFDRYYAQDNEEEETEMAGYAVYSAYSASCC